MKVYGIVCPKCETFVFSRAQHDFRSCPCELIFVDGGQDKDGYIRYGGGNAIFSRLTVVEREIPQTAKELYEDWNKRTDQYGHIKEKVTMPKIKTMRKPMNIKERKTEMVEMMDMYQSWEKLLNHMERYFSKNSAEYKTVLTIMDKVEEKVK